MGVHLRRANDYTSAHRSHYTRHVDVRDPDAVLDILHDFQYGGNDTRQTDHNDTHLYAHTYTYTHCHPVADVHYVTQWVGDGDDDVCDDSIGSFDRVGAWEYGDRFAE